MFFNLSIAGAAEFPRENTDRKSMAIPEMYNMQAFKMYGVCQSTYRYICNLKRPKLR